MADDAISDMKQIAPSKPFLVYCVPGGTHAFHHLTPLTAKFDRLTIKLDRPVLSEADRKRLQDAMLKRDGSTPNARGAPAASRRRCSAGL
jgi:hypothetical protein